MAGNKMDLNLLKSGGFIKERKKDLFTVRLRVPGGRLPVSRLAKIAAVAQKYGEGLVHLSVRQSIELIGRHEEIFKERDRKLEEARAVRRKKRQEASTEVSSSIPAGIPLTQAA